MPRRVALAPQAALLVDDAAGRPGRRARAKIEKRARILAAARELFSQKGFDATTTSELAQRADIGAGTLFLYVQSKEEVLVLTFQEDMTRVRDVAFASLPGHAMLLDELMHVYGAMTEFHERNRGLARVFAKEMAFVHASNRGALHQFMNGLHARWAERIAAAQDRRELAAEVPALLLSQNLFCIFFYHLQLGLGENIQLTSPEHLNALRAAFALQLRGLAPAPMRAALAARRARRPRRTPRRGARRNA